MSYSTKFFILLVILGFFLGAGNVLAQDDALEQVALDENVRPEDLGISEPNILPGNPAYFLKNFSRGVQNFFALSPVSKAELKLKFSSEKLMEARKLTQTKKDSEIIKKGLENYQQEIERIKSAADKIEERAAENQEVDKFLDKFVQQQILHQRVLQKLKSQVPSEAFAKIEDARLKHLESFGQVMEKLDDKTKIAERLDKNLKEIKGSQFKEFKALETLKEMKEKAPESIKEAIKDVQESSFNRLKNSLQEMSSEEQGRFNEYVEKVSGAKEKHLEILDDLKSGISSMPASSKIRELEENLRVTKEKVIEEIFSGKSITPCPGIPLSIPRDCKGRVVIEKNSAGCLVNAKCLVPSETSAPPSKKGLCVTLWDPVCGVNGKTYSNDCFAKQAGVEMDYPGVCRSSIKEEKIIRGVGEEEGSFLIQKINPDNIEGLWYEQYPLPSLRGAPKILHIGDDIGYACEGVSEKLISIDFSGQKVTFARVRGQISPSYGGCPICLAGNTLIDTPSGLVPAKDMRVGMPIWTINKNGHRVSGVVTKTSKVPVSPIHQMVYLVFDDGRELIISPGHPTIDGRSVGDLTQGDPYNGTTVVSAQRILYNESATYDVLPSEETGFYWANGVLLGSTLHF